MRSNSARVFKGGLFFVLFRAYCLVPASAGQRQLFLLLPPFHPFKLKIIKPLLTMWPLKFQEKMWKYSLPCNTLHLKVNGTSPSVLQTNSLSIPSFGSGPSREKSAFTK